MKIVKRSIRIARHNTSLSLESEFWDELKRLAKAQKLSLNQLVAKIDKARTGNLSSALRALCFAGVEAIKKIASSRKIFFSRSERKFIRDPVTGSVRTVLRMG